MVEVKNNNNIDKQTKQDKEPAYFKGKKVKYILECRINKEKQASLKLSQNIELITKAGELPIGSIGEITFLSMEKILVSFKYDTDRGLNVVRCFPVPQAYISLEPVENENK